MTPPRAHPRAVRAVPSLVHRLTVATAWSLVWSLAYERAGPALKSALLRRLGPAADFFYSHLGPEILLFLWGWLALPVLYVVWLGRLRAGFQGLLVCGGVLAFAGAVYWTPTRMALEAARICRTEGGLRVLGKMQAAGLHGVQTLQPWAAMGLPFVEYTDGLGRYLRVTSHQGREQRRQVAVLASRYELRALPPEFLSPRLALRRLVVRDRPAGSILGESRTVLFQRGWADRLLGNGFHFAAPTCAGGLPVDRGGPPAPDSEHLVRALLETSPAP